MWRVQHKYLPKKRCNILEITGWFWCGIAHYVCQWLLKLSLSLQLPYDLFCRTWSCLLCIFVSSRASLINIVNLGFFHWPFFVFMLQVTWLKVLFVVGVLSTSCACALLELIHQKPSCLLQLSVFKNITNITGNDFWHWFCIEHCISMNLNPTDRSHSRIISNEW